MIRKANRDDLRELIRMTWDFFDESMFSGEFRVRKCMDHFINLMDEHLFIVDERDGEITGYVAGFHIPYYFNDETEVQLNLFYIKPDRRGEGIASELLEATKEESDRLSASRIFAVNHSGVEKEAFRKMLENHGFTKFSDYMVK